MRHTLAFILLALAPMTWGDPYQIDFSRLRLHDGAKIADGQLHTSNPHQFAELDLPPILHNASSATIAVWVFPRRTGEQVFLSRGQADPGPNGERLFRRSDTYVNFLIGTDHRGFLMATINGNGTMPFVHVTLDPVPTNSWSQIVVVKTARGFHRFYRNGVLVHSDQDSSSSNKPWPFVDTDKAEPVRLSAPLGGQIAEAWVLNREMTAEEIAADFESKRKRFHPALPPKPVALREMNAYHKPNLWSAPISADNWPAERQRILAAVHQILGAMPTETVPLEPKLISEEDCGTYTRRKVSIQVQPNDRMPFWLLIPKNLKGKSPAIICFYGTTAGAGKDTTVGLSGAKPGSPPDRNRAFALDMVEAGFVAVAPDYLRDGERIAPGKRAYDTTDFYERHPTWSIHGKDAWDTMRLIDYLQTLDFVDADKIGMVGHSYGGHSTIFTTALEPRIKAAFANGPVSDFRGHGLHWAVPRGGGASQSLPNMRPYILDHTLKIPVEFYEWTALIAPRPLIVGQAVGELRPHEEENHAAVRAVYTALGHAEKVKYLWYAGDHDFPPAARKAAVEFFIQWLAR